MLNMILFPAAADRIAEPSGEIHTRERLGGLLKQPDKQERSKREVVGFGSANLGRAQE